MFGIVLTRAWIVWIGGRWDFGFVDFGPLGLVVCCLMTSFAFASVWFEFVGFVGFGTLCLFYVV